MEKQEVRAIADAWSEVVVKNREIFRMYQKKTYADAFFRLKKELAPVMKRLQGMALEEENQEALMDACLDRLFLAIAKEEQAKKGWFRKDLLMGFKMDLALFVTPAMLHMQLPVSGPFAAALVERWAQEYPGERFLQGTYEEIAAEFDKSGACYITSAVCEVLGKKEDGYELAMFRKFRDQYLLQQPYGRQYVDAYYRSAPGIVAMLHLQEDGGERLAKLWEDFLRPCLCELEQGHFSECASLYLEMVKQMERKYMPLICHTSFLQ